MAYSMKQLKMGKKVEREHSRTYKMLKRIAEKTGHLPSSQVFYKSIALDHIETEDPEYYTKLKKAGL
jgi:hypothetical protein